MSGTVFRLVAAEPTNQLARTREWRIKYLFPQSIRPGLFVGGNTAKLLKRTQIPE